MTAILALCTRNIPLPPLRTPRAIRKEFPSPRSSGPAPSRSYATKYCAVVVTRRPKAIPRKLCPIDLRRKIIPAYPNRDVDIVVKKPPIRPKSGRLPMPPTRIFRSLRRPTGLTLHRMLLAPLPPKRMRASEHSAHIVNFCLLPPTVEPAGCRRTDSRDTQRSGDVIGIAGGPKNAQFLYIKKNYQQCSLSSLRNQVAPCAPAPPATCFSFCSDYFREWSPDHGFPLSGLRASQWGEAGGGLCVLRRPSTSL